MYGASWCGHCFSQKKIFGNDFSKINYVECHSNTGQKNICSSKKIRGYPTWIINNNIYPGYKTLEQLLQLSS